MSPPRPAQSPNFAAPAFNVTDSMSLKSIGGTESPQAFLNKANASLKRYEPITPIHEFTSPNRESAFKKTGLGITKYQTP